MPAAFGWNVWTYSWGGVMVLFLRRLVTVLGLIAGLVVAQAAAPQEKAPRAATPPAPTPQAPDDALAGTR